MALSPKLWFRLQKLKANWLATFGVKEQSYDSAHRMCPNCRALIERGASECPLCGASVKPPRSRASSTPGRILGGIIPVPSTATSALVAANLALYAISWYLTQNLASAELNAAPANGGIDTRVLIRLGAKFGPYMVAGQWWRLVTAVFLHADLLHIGMNILCLIDLGRAVEPLFSTTKFIFFYLVAGIAGFVVSFVWSPYVPSVGASGAILGLIGVLIGASLHHGRLGEDVRRQLLRWLIYIGIFGVVFHADNAAHIGGLGTGFLFGYLVPEGEPMTRSSENLWNTLAVLCVLAIAGSFALMALQLIQATG
jgi:membrane associated rhomboid family serine protease